MAHLVAIAALHLAPIFGLRAVTREVTDFLAVAAGNVIRVAWLITLLCYMIL